MKDIIITLPMSLTFVLKLFAILGVIWLTWIAYEYNIALCESKDILVGVVLIIILLICGI